MLKLRAKGLKFHTFYTEQYGEKSVPAAYLPSNFLQLPDMQFYTQR